MGSGHGASEQLRTDPIRPRHNGPVLQPDSNLREPDQRHVVHSGTASDGMHAGSSTGDRLAMVVSKAAKLVKESNWTQRIIAAALIALLGMTYNLNREVGVGNAIIQAHIADHPNVALESDVRQLQERWLEHQTGHAE